MRILILLILFNCFFHHTVYSQNDKQYYNDAYQEQLAMIQGKKPIDFKRAVFLTENSYYKGKLNYQAYCNDISSTGAILKKMTRLKGIEKYKTAGNWAAFTYMTDSLPINNYKPYRYDFDDFMGDKDWTKMFVTKLMKTHTGNCHSLPFYYKILCEEIGAKASLALAPNHIYIKHLDEKNQWTNVELTNGGFPRDQWIIKEMAITVEAIKKGTYMSPLSAKQSIAMTLFDLACAYKFQFGNDPFILKIVNAALKYYPNCLPLIQEKANCIAAIIESEKKSTHPNKGLLVQNIALYKNTLALVDQLGYKDMPPEQYKDWVKAVEKEKAKRMIKN